MAYKAIPPLMLLPTVQTHCGAAFPGSMLLSFPLFPLLFYTLISFSMASLPGLDYDYGAQPRFVCTPIPADADPTCFTPGGVAHGPNHDRPSSNGHHGPSAGSPNGRGPMGMGLGIGISDEAKSTILHLRESLVRQKETILDQRETIRELTAKLTLCEGFDRGAGHHDGHHDDHHGPTHHNSHHPGSHHSYHENDHHGDLHYLNNGNRPDPLHRGKNMSGSKHVAFSLDQTRKTLQTLKERLENLQARNSSSSYSSSLRDLLQRKINALEKQLKNHYGYGHHDDDHDGHHGPGHPDDHQEEHHGTGHHDDHHDDHHDHHDGDHDDHHDDHHDTHAPTRFNNRHNYHHNSRPDDHYYERHYDRYYDRHGRHDIHNNLHHDDHHDDHHDKHHDDNHDDHHGDHHDDHHDAHPDDHHDEHHGNSQHGNEDLGNHPRPPYNTKPPALRPPGRGHNKLDTVLSHLHHRNTDTVPRKKPKSPDAFQIGFPMRTNYMYGRIKRTLMNEIFALTICLWLKGGSGPGLGTPFSYSVPGQANELVLIEWDNNPVELLVNDKAVTLPIVMTDGKWHHLCVTWSTHDGHWEAFQDGLKRGSGEELSAWHPIKPGGVFILGQEQDTLGGRFDATQSFVGEMSDLQLWSRVLTPNEIYSQASCGGHLAGDVISWTEAVVELHGGVTKYPFDPCH
ncbi:hypothetical protein UPYG_G00339630 [Umbra pygmaea]|uniref:Pentraxin (PTX) domain-containing protein n=1 Tax=Umbra pygmaea TaxID=75934 RepID=A0ABD0WD12_UMBPY